MEKVLYSTVGNQYLPHAGTRCLKGRVTCLKTNDPWSTANGNSPAKKAAKLQLIWNHGIQTAHLSIPLLA